MAQRIDGARISAQVKEEVKERVAGLLARGRETTLAVVWVGEDPASSVYVGNKEKACGYVGIRSRMYHLPEHTTQEELLFLIGKLNADEEVDGILVQLPLPPQIDASSVVLAIDPKKDVDGFHPLNAGRLFLGEPCFVPCTPAGILELLRCSDVALEGKECVVVGRSNLVGKPMAALLLRENATVTVCHSKTGNLREITRRADVLIVAVGRPEFVTADDVKEGAVVIDVGIHRREGKKLCGDVAFEAVEPIASKITPVPGGVGPMTVAMLLKNCVEASEQRAGREQAG